MKTLVTYFSASGTTERAAKRLAEAIGADVYEIVPKQPYTSADLDWTNSKSRSTVEMKDKHSRPEIVNTKINLQDYDKVVIGFPVWWYTAPTIINTFIENHDLTNKDLYVFVTSGGSNYVDSMRDLQKMYPSLNFVKGMRIAGSTKEQELKELVK